MSVDFCSGDLFDPGWGFDALAHGVNAIGAMGKGIAVEFRRKWPTMYDEYTSRCRRGSLRPGMAMPWWTPGKGKPRVVYNLCTQATIGKQQDGTPPASLQDLEEAVRDMLVHAAFSGVKSIGLPRIGAGLGGLPWTQVKGFLQRVGEHTCTMLVVFESYIRGDDATEAQEAS